MGHSIVQEKDIYFSTYSINNWLSIVCTLRNPENPPVPDIFIECKSYAGLCPEPTLMTAGSGAHCVAAQTTISFFTTEKDTTPCVFFCDDEYVKRDSELKPHSLN